jgi:hypothetical protein
MAQDVLRKNPRNTGKLQDSGIQTSERFKQDFFALLDGGRSQFPIDAFGTFDERFELSQGFLSSCERLLTATELLVREVLGEGGAGPADAETPSFEGCAFVCESSQVTFGFHSLLVDCARRMHMTARKSTLFFENPAKIVFFSSKRPKKMLCKPPNPSFSHAPAGNRSTP